MRPMHTRRLGLGGSRFALRLSAVAFAGAAVGMVLPQPCESAHAAQPPLAAERAASAPVLFSGAQPPPTDESPSADDAAETEESLETDEEPAPPIATRTFTTPAAMVINYVLSGSATGFEALTRRMVQALAASEDGQHQALAAGWTMYRVVEPGPNNNAVYVWLFDPVVPDANYAVPQLLNELFPAEVQQLYESYMQFFGMGQTPLELQPVELVEDPG